MTDYDADEPKEYRWETGYEKTWEAIQEDEDGLLDSAVTDLIMKAKRRRQTEKAQQNRLGMMRHLYIIIDGSEAMSLPDLKPTRMMCTVKLLEIFIDEYFDQNPISQLGLIILKSKRAEKLTELTGTNRLHLNALEELRNYTLTGEPSLQNGLDTALKSLKVVPSHASREILVIMGSLTTCDPVDMSATIDSLREESIRCSVISLSAEIHICRYLTQQTNGTYGAILDDAHFRNLLLSHVDPPTATQTQDNSLIRMGFPHAKADEGKDPPLSMCMCHLDESGNTSKLTSAGYYCPQCNSKYCELPVECRSCSLTLVSAPHLARSYHHLFPIGNFIEIEYEQQAVNCYSCQRNFTETDKLVYRCETCLQIFCIDCDIFIHETLHICVGCNTIPTIAKQVQQRKPQAPSSIIERSKEQN